MEIRLRVVRSDAHATVHVGHVRIASGVGPGGSPGAVEILRLDLAELRRIVADVGRIPEHVRKKEPDVPLGIRNAGRERRVGRLDGSDGVRYGKGRSRGNGS